MKNELLYRMALTRIPGLGPVKSKKLYEFFGTAKAIFQADETAINKSLAGDKSIIGSTADLSTTIDINHSLAKTIKAYQDFDALEKEYTYLERSAIRILFYKDKEYPQRLLKQKSSPTLLYYLGTADLNAKMIISVIGTRKPTEYARHATERLIRELAGEQILIISGLAYGIDTVAHSAALQNNLPTIGILGHGLDRVYPAQNIPVAREMARKNGSGGLLSQFRIGCKPNEHHFPLRNQIVAGLCDALVVVETGCKGGSMLTVKNALEYGKPVFAIPGRITEDSSAGCHQLISEGKASTLTSGRDLIRIMEWQPKESSDTQLPLFPQPASLHQSENQSKTTLENLSGNHSFSPEEKAILALLKEKGIAYVDELSPIPTSNLAMILLNLEMAGFIKSLPGKRYRLSE